MLMIYKAIIEKFFQIGYILADPDAIIVLSSSGG